MPDKASRWLGWGVLASVVPFIIQAFAISTKQMVTWDKLFKDGDLLLVAAAVGFTAVGELVASDVSKSKPKIWLSAVCGVCSIVEAGLYGLVHADPGRGDATNVSITLFFATLFSGYACIVLSD